MVDQTSPLAETSTVTRREFIRLSSLAAAGLLAGCATNPVTGKSQLMLVSEDQEVQIDRQYSPYQFSADYGKSQDRKLNSYLDRTGQKMAARSHRPHGSGNHRGPPRNSH